MLRFPLFRSSPSTGQVLQTSLSQWPLGLWVLFLAGGGIGGWGAQGAPPSWWDRGTTPPAGQGPSSAGLDTLTHYWIAPVTDKNTRIGTNHRDRDRDRDRQTDIQTQTDLQAAVFGGGVVPAVVLRLQLLHDVAELLQRLEGLLGVLDGELGVLVLLPLGTLVHSYTGTRVYRTHRHTRHTMADFAVVATYAT